MNNRCTLYCFFFIIFRDCSLTDFCLLCCVIFWMSTLCIHLLQKITDKIKVNHTKIIIILHFYARTRALYECKVLIRTIIALFLSNSLSIRKICVLKIITKQSFSFTIPFIRLSLAPVCIQTRKLDTHDRAHTHQTHSCDVLKKAVKQHQSGTKGDSLIVT